MFETKDYINFERLKQNFDANNFLKALFDMDSIIDKKEMEKDILSLKENLIKVAKLYGKKLIFVVDKEHVEMFESTEDEEEE